MDGIILEIMTTVLNAYSSSLPTPYGSLQGQDFILALTRGESRAYDALYKRFSGPLRYYAFKFTGDTSIAEDIVQTVLGEKLPAQLKLYQGEFKLQAWLYQVTRNLALTHVRDRKSREGVLATRPEFTCEEYLEDPDQRIYDQQLKLRIEASIRRLTFDHQDILYARYLDDLSYKEIAEAFDIKLGTVMSRLSRAQKELRRAAPYLEDLLV